MCNLEEIIRLAENSPSETELKTRFSDFKLNKCGKPFKKKTFCFNSWLVGFTDGDGCFNIYINPKNNKIIFTFKVGQKINNKQVLYFIKKQLKVGSVTLEKTMANFLVRNRQDLLLKIVPIFDKFKLLTSKEWVYLRFKEALLISLNPLMSAADKIDCIKRIKLQLMPNNFISPSLLKISLPLNKWWLVGFVEAEGSFYITKKDEQRLVHGFGITQKRDKLILDYIKKTLNIESGVRLNKNYFYSLDTTNSNSLKFIKDYFFKALKSRKALVYRIWARSFRLKNKFNKLLLIQKLIRSLY